MEFIQLPDGRQVLRLAQVHQLGGNEDLVKAVQGREGAVTRVPQVLRISDTLTVPDWQREP